MRRKCKRISLPWFLISLYVINGHFAIKTSFFLRVNFWKLFREAVWLFRENFGSDYLTEFFLCSKNKDSNFQEAHPLDKVLLYQRNHPPGDEFTATHTQCTKRYTPMYVFIVESANQTSSTFWSGQSGRPPEDEKSALCHALSNRISHVECSVCVWYKASVDRIAPLIDVHLLVDQKRHQSQRGQRKRWW